MQREHHHMRDTLIAFGLKVMFSHPKRIISQAVYNFGNGLGFGMT